MLEVKNLCKNYGEHRVLDNISFNVDKGEVIAIIGGSGCGKSTLLRCLNHIEEVTKGEILFNGENINNIPNYHQKVGMVFQQFNLFPHLSVIDNITLAPVKLHLMSKEEAEKKARKLLKDINLLEKENSRPSNLSGGEQQRVAIARAIVNDPRVLICDEPTGNLDPAMSMEIVELLDDINKKEGTTVLMVTHDAVIVNKMKKHVIALKDGHLFKDYKKGEYIDEIL